MNHATEIQNIVTFDTSLDFDTASRIGRHAAALAAENRLLRAFVAAWQDAAGYSDTSRAGRRLADAYRALDHAGILATLREETQDGN